MASSSPPPTTAPCSAATKGIGPRAIRSNTVVPVVATALARRLDLAGGARQRLGQVQPGAEVGAVAVQHDDIGVLMGAQHAARSSSISASLIALRLSGRFRPIRATLPLSRRVRR
jgi:hypothetical protein